MIDAHIHLDDSRFDENRSELIQQALDAGIKKFITPAVMISSFEKLHTLSIQFEMMRPSYGLHPYFIDQHQPDDLKYLDLWLSAHPSSAVGECGLDYFLKDLDRQLQHFYFEAQIELAKKHNLPLILHARGGVESVFSALKNANYFNAMIHSYNGSIEQTKQLLDKGVKFSFGGAICNPKAHKLHKLVNYCPIDALMFETDAPDQPPYGNFKQINVPVNLIQIIKYYSELSKIKFELCQENSSKVAKNFFNID